MEDLLESQIRHNCRLALPDGLKDLMADISREVLRAQPADLYNFIVNYLEALLLARDTLTIACQVCSDVCECICQPELDIVLKNLGLDGEDLDTAKNVVMEYFDKDEVKEGNILMKLLKTTNMDEGMLPAVQKAVRESFLKNQLELRTKIKAEAGKVNERGQDAVLHTLRYYEHNKNKHKEAKEAAAKKIQSCFRAYLIRRSLIVEPTEKDYKGKGSTVQVISNEKRSKKEPAVKPSTSKPNGNQGRLSSTSLAGSFLHLPKYVPYSVHDLTLTEYDECEMEHHNIDFTLESDFKDAKTDKGKKIVFHEKHILHEIKSCSLDEEEIETCIGEEIVAEEIVDGVVEDIQSDVTEELDVEENISNVNLLAKDFAVEVISTAIGEETREMETHDEGIAENTPESIVSSVDEIIDEQVKTKTLDIDEEEDFTKDIIDLYDDND